MTGLILFQPTETAAMMPYRLGLNANRILAIVAASHHLSKEMMNFLRRHSKRSNPSYLTTMYPMMAFGSIYSHNCILRMILAVSIPKVQQFIIVKAIADRPFVIGHGLYQIIFSFQLLEGKYAFRMLNNHHLIDY
jgi:hypothetical protein